MREKGVILRTWRVGTDVIEETVRLVEEARAREEQAGRKQEGQEVGVKKQQQQQQQGREKGK